jgi:hypothetical protein
MMLPGFDALHLERPPAIAAHCCASLTGCPSSVKPSATRGDPVRALVLRTDQENADYIRAKFGALRKGRPRRAGYCTDAFERGNERGADVSLVPMSRLRPRDTAALPDSAGG